MALTVGLSIVNPAASMLSTNGGKIKITGTGFPETWPNSYYNRLAFATGTRNLPLSIESMTAN